jgi:hypothetical protein
MYGLELSNNSQTTTQVDITLNIVYSKWYVKVYAYVTRHPVLLVMVATLLDRNAVKYVRFL